MWLDGYIEGPDGDLSWFTEDTSYDGFITDVLRSIDGMIFGRKAHAVSRSSGRRPSCRRRLAHSPSASTRSIRRSGMNQTIATAA